MAGPSVATGRVTLVWLALAPEGAVFDGVPGEVRAGLGVVEVAGDESSEDVVAVSVWVHGAEVEGASFAAAGLDEVHPAGRDRAAGLVSDECVAGGERFDAGSARLLPDHVEVVPLELEHSVYFAVSQQEGVEDAVLGLRV